MSQDKKHQQLGMNPSTASGRLVKDVLYKLVVDTGQNECYRCGFQMSRETFSIEHKSAWLDSDDPVKNYFDLDNISFSHLLCNVKAATHVGIKKPCGTLASYKRGCRCEKCAEKNSEIYKSRYTPELRKERYGRTGR